MSTLKKLLATSAFTLVAATGTAQAASLTLYCSAQEDWCQLVANTFEETSGIEVNMTRKSSGERLPKLKLSHLTRVAIFGGVVQVIRICKLLKKT